MVGRLLSHYRILQKLGQGGMGEVYLAEDSILGRKVALKFLPKELQRDPLARQRFIQEARSAAALDHPGICKIYEIGRVEGSGFIAMEYVEGQTLRQRLAGGPVSLKEAVALATQIVEALEEAHQKNIVHRDLKPANIMLTSRGHVKVMDFGLAKRLASSDVGSSMETLPESLTRPGTTLGTLAYMSPEQLSCETADVRSDIFSFGIILYEMLSGIHPFRKSSPVETATAILSETPAPLSRYVKGIPELLQHTVGKTLNKKKEERQQSVHEVLTNLGKLLEESAWKEEGKPTAMKRALTGFWLTPSKSIYYLPLMIVLIIGSLGLWFFGIRERPALEPGKKKPPSRFLINLPAENGWRFGKVATRRIDRKPANGDTGLGGSRPTPGRDIRFFSIPPSSIRRSKLAQKLTWGWKKVVG